MRQERNPVTVSQLVALMQFWSNPRSQSNFFYFWVPEHCRVVILDCRVIHRMVRELQETLLNDHLLNKDNPQ